PGQVALVAGLEGGRQRGDYRVDFGGRVEVAPRLDVHRDVALAEDLGEVPGGGAPEDLELEQPVLRRRVAGAPPEVGVGVARDRRDAECVADDPHAGFWRLGRTRRGAELRVLVA